MIRNNLASLLAERSLKITKVAIDTGLSRNTVTSTVQNDGKMIQLETVNTLCRYLQITPGDFFSFLPYDIDFSVFPNDNLKLIKTAYNDVYKIINCSFDCYISIIYQDKKYSFDITAIMDGNTMYISKDNLSTNAKDQYEIHLHFLLNQSNEIENNKFKDIWNKMPAGFKTDLTKKMIVTVGQTFFDTIDKLSRHIFLYDQNDDTHLSNLKTRITLDSSFESLELSEFNPKYIDNEPSLYMEDLPF